MREETRQFLFELKQSPLFEAVGKHDCEDKVLLVTSWAEAIEISESEANDVIRTERHNEVTEQIPYERFQLWNALVEEIKSELVPIIEARVGLLELNSRQQRCVFNAAAWDLVGAGMEHEYAYVISSRFNRDLAQWYLRGHFVCGWDYTEGYFRTILY